MYQCPLYLLIFFLVLSQSIKITLWDHLLPLHINSFCAGVYNDEITIYGGWCTEFGSVRGSYSSSNADFPWTWNNQTYPFNSHGVNFVSGCVQIPDDPLLYAVPAKVNVDGVDIRWGEHVFIYDLSIHKFVDTSSYQSVLPYHAFHACIIIVNNNDLYVIAGIYNNSATQRVQVYDISMDSWSQKSSLNINRNHNGCAMKPNSNNIYTFGGSTTDGTKFDSIERYNISNDEWIQIDAKLVIPRDQLKCDHFNNRIFCNAGFTNAGTLETLIEVFNPINERILTLDYNLYLNFGRYYSQSVVFNNSLLILGGRNGSLRWNSIERILIDDMLLTDNPTDNPTVVPTVIPTIDPTQEPTIQPTMDPMQEPTVIPTIDPTSIPTSVPTISPIANPTINPSEETTHQPSIHPTSFPTDVPSATISPSIDQEGNVTASTAIGGNDKSEDESFLTSDNFYFELIIIIVLLCCVICIVILIIHRKRKNKQQQMNADGIGIELDRVKSQSNVINTNDEPRGVTLIETHHINTVEDDEPVVPQVNAEPDVYSDPNALVLWLKSIGLVEYFDLFKEQGFHEQIGTLNTLTDNDLQSIGISKLAHRKRILMQIENMNNIVYSNIPVNNINMDGYNAGDGQQQFVDDNTVQNMNTNPTNSGSIIDHDGNNNQMHVDNDDYQYEYDDDDDDDDDNNEEYEQLYSKADNPKPSPGGPIDTAGK